MEEYIGIVRGLLAGEAMSSGGAFQLDGAELGVASPQPGGPPISVEAVGQPQIEAAARVADNVVVAAGSVRDVHAAVALIRSSAEAAGRDPATLGIALEVPVSIGRTWAEAQARADSEPLFETIGQPMKTGIFGTLEECQLYSYDSTHNLNAAVSAATGNPASDRPDVMLRGHAYVKAEGPVTASELLVSVSEPYTARSAP